MYVCYRAFSKYKPSLRRSGNCSLVVEHLSVRQAVLGLIPGDSLTFLNSVLLIKKPMKERERERMHPMSKI